MNINADCLSGINGGQRFGIKHPSTELAAELHAFAESISAGDVVINKLRTEEQIENEDFPTSRLVIEFSRLREQTKEKSNG